MDRYVISYIANCGRRYYLRRAVPIEWSDYECFALPMSDFLSKNVLAFLKGFHHNGVFERKKYHPPKLP